MVNIGFIKMGNLGMSQVINLIQDEIAAREGITVRVFSTGAKMSPAEAADTENFKQWNPDFVVIISPNAAAPGPTAAREIWKDGPCIVVSDGPTKKEAREALGSISCLIWHLRTSSYLEAWCTPVHLYGLEATMNTECYTHMAIERGSSRA